MSTPESVDLEEFAGRFPVYAIVFPPFNVDSHTGQVVVNERTNWHVLQKGKQVALPIFTNEGVLLHYQAALIRQVSRPVPISTAEILAGVLRNILSQFGAKADVLLDPSERIAGPIISFDEIVSGPLDAS